MPRYLVNVSQAEFDVEIEHRPDGYVATINGKQLQIASHRLGDTRSLLLIDGRSHEVDVRSNGYDNRRIVFMNGVEIPVEIEDYNLARLRATAGIASQAGVDRFLRAAMPGLVVNVLVKSGDQVTEGQGLLLIEAMKMENLIKASADATVRTINVSRGKSVEKGDILMEFE